MKSNPVFDKVVLVGSGRVHHYQHPTATGSY